MLPIIFSVHCYQTRGYYDLTQVKISFQKGVNQVIQLELV